MPNFQKVEPIFTHTSFNIVVSANVILEGKKIRKDYMSRDSSTGKLLQILLS